MNDARIRKLIEAYGFSEAVDKEIVFRLCKDVERETRQDFFDVIQVANRIASGNVFTGRELDGLAFNKEFGK